MKKICKQLISASAMSMMFACSMVDNSDPELVEKYEAQQQAVKDSVAQVEQDIKDSIKKEEQDRKDSIAKVDEATCPETFTDTRDENVYDIVRVYDPTIDNKASCWFKQNLKYEVKGESFCLDDEKSNCKEYGRLYVGSVLKQGVCPAGSRVSSQEDWDFLLKVVDHDQNSAYLLKAEGAWNVSGTAAKPVDGIGFSALPGGFYDDDMEEYPEEFHNDGHWWVYSKDSYKYVRMEADNDFYEFRTIDAYNSSGIGLSIRCVIDSSYVAETPDSSSSDGEETASSSSVEGGESDSSSSGEAGSSSSGEVTSSSSGTTTSSSSEGTTAESSSSVVDEEDLIVAYSDVTIDGVSQKGPFVKGSTVSVYELENGRNLSPKGTAFPTTITTDDGKFKLTNLKLKSQFVYFVAEGYYRNENTGENSAAPITLKAVSDLTKMKTINVNLLTHLEFYRADYLVVNKGLRVSKAKIQADKEIFANFFIDASNFKAAEKLSVVGTSEEDAALLALSVIFQGGFKEAELTDVLATFSDEIKLDGEWKNDSLKTVLADWVAGAEMKDHFKSIRNNVKAWGLGEPGDFEKYLTNFWTKVLKVGDCTSTRNGTIIAVKDNAYSKYYSLNEKAANRNTRLTCKAGKWEEASTFEKDTYQWGTAMDGKVEKGSVTDTFYVYDGTWRVASDDEKALNMGCTAKMNNKMFVDAKDEYHLCVNKVWTSTTEDQRNTYSMATESFWADATDGKVKIGEVKPPVSYYVYDELGTGWRKGDANDYDLGFDGCTIKRHGEINTVKSDETMYVCDVTTTRWKEISPDDAAKYGKECKKDGDTVLTRNGRLWICDMVDARDWRLGNSTEQLYGACVASNLGDTVVVSVSDTVMCDNGHNWVPYTFFKRFKGVDKSAFRNKSISYGTLPDKRDNQTYATVTIDGVEWMAENLNYNNTTKHPNLVGQTWCYDDDDDACALAGRLYSWTAAKNLDSKYLTEAPIALDVCLYSIAYDYCNASEKARNDLKCVDATTEEIMDYFKDNSMTSTVEALEKEFDNQCYSQNLVRDGEVEAGICPENWRLPTRDELEAVLFAMYAESPRSFLSAYPEMWPGTNLDDYVGFSLLSSGARIDGVYTYAGTGFAFWVAGEMPSSSERPMQGLSVNYVWNKDEPYGDSFDSYPYKTNGYSVRCVRYKDDNGNLL